MSTRLHLASSLFALGAATIALAQAPATTSTTPSTTATAAPTPTPPAAPPPPPAPDLPKFELRLGGFLLSNLNTKMELDTPTHGSGLIDFTEALGGKTSLSVFRADADWHLGKSHEISATWYDLKTTGQRTLSGTISWGDQVYPVGTTVASEFRTNIYKIAYGYYFNRGAKHEFMGLIGAHVLQIQTSIRATNTSVFESFSGTAPLPAIGGAWIAHWSDRFSTRTSLQVFGVSFNEGEISGHFIDFLLAAQYKIGKQWGLGAGYNRFDLQIDFKRNNRTLKVEHAYDGALAFLFAEF